MIIKILLLIVYIFVGIIFDSAIKEEWEKPSIIIITLYPIVLSVIAILKIIEIAMNIGEKIHDMIGKKLN